MVQNFTEKILSITDATLNKKELHGIVDILKQITEAVDSCCCILWETDPWADTKVDPPTGNLHVFARWLCDEIEMPLKELPIVGSLIGLAVGEEKTICSKDIRDDLRAYKSNNWIYEYEITSMCAVPIKFDSDIYNASLTLYRRKQVKPFTNQEQKFIEQIANLIPPLYQAIRDKVGRNLLLEINNILEEAEHNAREKEMERKGKIEAEESEIKFSQGYDELEEITDGLRKICEATANTFQCIETSLFLENRLETENQFKLVASSYLEWTSEKKIYKPEQDKEHLTGWVLRNKESVNVFDLGNFFRDKEKLREKYKDINWKDSLNIKRAAGRILNLSEEELPTLSFMAVPIKKGNKLLGVIRCCTAKKDPWFFADRQVSLLELVASQISRFWNDWLQHLEEKRESERWEKFIKKISELNAVVQERIDKSDVDEDKLFERILNLARSSIKHSDILDIRLRDEKTNELYFAKTLGFSSKRDNNIEIQRRKNKRFSLDKNSYKEVPLGVLVFEKKEPLCVMDAKLENYQSTTFPKTKRILVVPIGIQKNIIGVLDIRGTSDEQFPPHALQMATLLGQQLGLYLSLWKSEKQQRQVFEDLFHQTKGPVRHIFARAQDLLQSIDYERWHQSDSDKIDKIKNKTLMLRGVARKAQKVIVNAGVFKNFSSEEKLKLTDNKIKQLSSNDTVRMLFESYKDTEILLESSRKIKFYINTDSFDRLDKMQVNADYDFLEQAINCLLDNAGKYSFSETTVRIIGGEVNRYNKDYFYIGIINEGFEIKTEEIPRLKERYYRGPGAKKSTGEGSGIGLWVVDHIMQAHNGELEIIPTNLYGKTEVRLLFPIEK